MRDHQREQESPEKKAANANPDGLSSRTASLGALQGFAGRETVPLVRQPCRIPQSRNQKCDRTVLALSRLSRTLDTRVFSAPAAFPAQRFCLAKAVSGDDDQHQS